MRVTLQVGNTTIGQEVKTQAEAFEFMASVAEIFGEPCGMCGSKDVEPVVQKFNDKVFKKLRCRACTATVLLFSRDDGGMWIVRTDKQKQPVGKKGWSIYKKDDKPAERTSQAEDRHPQDEPGSNDDGREVPF